MSLAGLLISLLVAGPGVLVPRPVSMTESEGVYICPEQLTYSVKGSVEGLDGLEEYLTGSLPAMDRAARGAAVSFRFGRLPEGDGYSLTVNSKGIRIEASTTAGAFYAVQSLMQMRMASDTLQCCTIQDRPRFGYRGFMLDLAATWHDLDSIKRQIDAMALCKLNVLHLHLTDTQGWRIESETWPQLHREASWRYGRSDAEWKANRMFALVGAPGASGGYYSKDELRELVRYAAARHIEIIPEIDLPGHTFAALSVLKDLRCDSYTDAPSDGGLPPYLVELCVGNPETFDFVFSILDEVAELFPSRYIHIGGDEARMASWKTCTKCQALMRREGMTDVRQLQHWFTAKVCAHLKEIGRIPIGWDEYADGDIPADAVIMKWHEDCALPEPNPVIMATHRYTYLCYYQDAPVFEPLAYSRYLPLDGVYLWEPLAEPGLPDGVADRILGLESCLWTAEFPSDAMMDYMTWPRLAALAERAWSPADVRDYAAFRGRAEHFCAALDKLGTGHFDLSREVGHRPEKLAGVRHLALGCKVSSSSSISVKYPASGLSTLTDGKGGDWNGDDGNWLGVEGEADFTVDLGESKPVHYVGASFLCHRGYSRDLPFAIEVSFSEDGDSWSEPVRKLCPFEIKNAKTLYPTLGVPVNANARYVRYRAIRRPGPLKLPLLLDEIVVN